MLRQLIVGLIFVPISLIAQTKDIYRVEQGKFYGYPALQILACQIDGDNASGYNKFGYQAEVVVGLGLDNNGSIEYSMGLSQRGSRRPSDPNDISITPFNLSINCIDQGLYYGKLFKNAHFIHVKLGVRVLNVIGASESEGYVLNPEENLRKTQVLGDANFVWALTGHFALKGSFQYSLTNINAQKSIQTDVWGNRGSALHNNIGLGVLYAF